MKVICYLSGGYPTMEKSLDMAGLYVEGGCDAIEWNFPPQNPYLETDYISAMMKIARESCADYQIYMNSLSEFKRKYPLAQVIPMLYQETILEIGGDRLVIFCHENGINTIISADITDTQLKCTLAEGGIHIAPFVSHKMKKEMVDMAIHSDGFVYMQAMPYADENTSEFDPNTLKTCIRVLRDKGITRPIYCGGGIRSVHDVDIIKAAGGDGFFLGSSIMQYYEKPQVLLSTIREYKAAANRA